jgi:beta-glucanase (GH16 family)
MLFRSRTRRIAVLLMCAALLLPVGPSWANHADPPGPTHAGNTFGWYPTAWRDEFVGPLKSVWHKRGSGVVKTKNGMLTLRGRGGTVSATLDMAGHDTGRWEIRWKSKQYADGKAPYTVRTELIPAGDRPQYCGARNIALESYTHGHGKAKFYIHNLPKLAFTAAKSGRFGHDNWHTFAVEVTPEHISWFVDAHVISTERRPEAYSGVPLTVRFSLNAKPGTPMNRVSMQMDWLRYWTLAKPNDKSISAPAPAVGTYAKACPPPA